MDPLHQFHIETLIPINLAGIDFSFNNSALWMLMVVIAIGVLMEIGLRKGTIVPSRLQSLIEILYQFVARTVRDNAGPEASRHIPFVFTLFMFILVGNLLGMVPGSFTVTSHLIITLALAAMVFLLTLAIGFLRHGVHYLGIFFPSGAPLWLAPLLIPIEIMSYLARPIGLSVRLFANMMAGHTMMKVFAGFSVMAVDMFGFAGGLAVAIGPVAINAALTGFETMIAVLQAYVFMILTCLYLRDALHLQH